MNRVEWVGLDWIGVGFTVGNKASKCSTKKQQRRTASHRRGSITVRTRVQSLESAEFLKALFPSILKFKLSYIICMVHLPT
jgi:hypothetical protein